MKLSTKQLLNGILILGGIIIAGCAPKNVRPLEHTNVEIYQHYELKHKIDGLIKDALVMENFYRPYGDDQPRDKTHEIVKTFPKAELGFDCIGYYQPKNNFIPEMSWARRTLEKTFQGFFGPEILVLSKNNSNKITLVFHGMDDKKGDVLLAFKTIVEKNYEDGKWNSPYKVSGEVFARKPTYNMLFTENVFSPYIKEYGGEITPNTFLDKFVQKNSTCFTKDHKRIELDIIGHSLGAAIATHALPFLDGLNWKNQNVKHIYKDDSFVSFEDYPHKYQVNKVTLFGAPRTVSNIGDEREYLQKKYQNKITNILLNGDWVRYSFLAKHFHRNNLYIVDPIILENTSKARCDVWFDNYCHHTMTSYLNTLRYLRKKIRNMPN